MNIAAIEALKFDPVKHCYTVRDTILYALSLGYGSAPNDPKHLLYTLETNLVAVPSYCVVLAHPGFWMQRPELEIHWLRMLHGEQSFELHRALPVEGAVHGEYQVVAVEDRGPGKGAVLHQLKKLYDDATGDLLATVRGLFICRDDGGCGGFGEPPPPSRALGDGAPTRKCSIGTSPRSGLIYRLNGDMNPIHADPDSAMHAGFKAPILHGLCTLGVATRAILNVLVEDQPQRIAQVQARFSSPVYPGETLNTEFFPDGSDWRFRTCAVERGVIVLDRGQVTLTS